MREGCSDGGWASDCKSDTLETQGVRIPLFPLRTLGRRGVCAGLKIQRTRFNSLSARKLYNMEKLSFFQKLIQAIKKLFDKPKTQEEQQKPIVMEEQNQEESLKTTNYMFTVLLDNGHGVNTPGKCSPKKDDGTRFREYKFARTITAQLDTKLKALGYNVFIVTPEQEDISLGERVRRINKVVQQYGAGNCLMISVHANAAGSNDQWMSARGWSAWTTRGQNNSDKLAEYLYDAAETLMKNDIIIKASYAGETKQKMIRTDLTDKDRDLESDFYIIKHSNCPAVLTENFFQDNKKDVEILESKHGIDLITDIHAQGIINYVKSKQKS